MPKKKIAQKPVKMSKSANSSNWERLNTVTPVSKALAYFLFLVLPLAAFYFGALYQEAFNFLGTL